MRLVTTPRVTFLRALADEILQQYGHGRMIVAIDGPLHCPPASTLVSRTWGQPTAGSTSARAKGRRYSTILRRTTTCPS